MKHVIILFSLLILAHAASAEQIDSLAADSLLVESPAADSMSSNALWDSANTAYINGDYASAIELYKAIEQRGLASDKFYFNLGNAYYKSDDIARAILYYQKALLISPRDVDILYNLGVAQSQTRDQIEQIPEFFLGEWIRSVGRAFGCMGWTITSIVALAVMLLAILLFMLGGAIRVRKIGFGVALFAALIFIVSTLYALDERSEILDHNQAVVMSQSISIKSSPDHAATDLFMLHSGTTVKIMREIDGWCEIVITDGKKGWIESRRIEKI